MANTGTKREESPHEIPHTGWQPIETAPRDGTEILAFAPWWSPDRAVIIEWCSGDGCWDVSDDVEGYAGANVTPTHWMPLPDPPRR